MGHDHSHENMAPTVPLMLAGGLVLITLLGVIWQQAVVNPAATVRQAPSVVAERYLQFADRPNGAVAVIAMPDGEELAIIEAGDGNFLRGTLRGLIRERRMHDAPMSMGFVVRRYSDGAIAVIDLATDRVIDLRAFGAENASEFVRYLPDSGSSAGEDATRFAQAEE